MVKRVFGGAVLSAFVALGAGACGDATAPGGTGHLSVTLGALDGASSAAVSELSPRLSQVELGSVESIFVTIHRVQVHRVDADENGEDGGNGGNGEARGWIDLDVTEAEIDLMDLSTVPDPIEVAEGELPVADYDGVRFFFREDDPATEGENEGPTILFAEGSEPENPATGEPISEAGVVIPSGFQTGIKVPGASFTIDSEGVTEFTALFDENTSVQNVNITGTGQVMMAPVLVGEADGGA